MNDLIKKAKPVNEKKDHRVIFDFSYTLFIWIVIRIIQFTEFSIQTYLVVFLTTIIFLGLLEFVFFSTTYTGNKRIAIIVGLIITLIIDIFLFCPFRFYNVELWRFVLIISAISGTTTMILIFFYYYKKGKVSKFLRFFSIKSTLKRL